MRHEARAQQLGVVNIGSSHHCAQRPTAAAEKLCLDQGYDNPTGRQAVAAHGYQGQIRRLGEGKLDSQGVKCHPARRWVVERTLAWLSKCRAILVRYDKKVSTYVGLIQLACALFWYRRRTDSLDQCQIRF